MLPEGWVKLTLSEACEMKAGKFVKAEDIAREPTEASYPCYGGNGLRGYTPSYTHDGCYPLIGRQGELCGNVMFAAGKFHATEHAVVVKAKDYTDTTWLYFKLVDLKLNRYATGQAQPGLSVKNLENISFIAPRCALEQKKIAQILSTWDNAISATERLLENSQQRKKALMQQLLTGKKRLPGFEGEWESHLLEDMEEMGLVELGRGNVISKVDIEKNPGSYPIYSSSIKNQGLMGTYGRYMFDEELISWSVDGGGDFFYRPRHKFSVTNVSGYMRLNTSVLNYKFVAEQLILLHQKYAFDYQSKAHPSVIRKLYVLNVPCLAEQQAIANVLTTADQEIDALQKRLDHLKQEKKALMQQLLTGKRRVQVDDAA